MYKTEVGKQLIVGAPLAVPLAVVALVTRRRWLGICCVVPAGLLLGWLVVQVELDLHPETGERRVLASFVPPAGARSAGEDAFRGFSFPSLSAAWEVRAPVEQVCRDASERMAEWSETPPRRLRQSCLTIGTRDGHVATVYVSIDHGDPEVTEVVFTVTRDV